MQGAASDQPADADGLTLTRRQILDAECRGAQKVIDTIDSCDKKGSKKKLNADFSLSVVRELEAPEAPEAPGAA